MLSSNCVFYSLLIAQFNETVSTELVLWQCLIDIYKFEMQPSIHNYKVIFIINMYSII